MYFSPRKELRENKLKHLLHFPESIFLVEMFSDFPFVHIYLSLRGKHTIAKTAVSSATFKQKGGFQNIKTKPSKDYFSNLCLLQMKKVNSEKWVVLSQLTELTGKREQTPSLVFSTPIIIPLHCVVS